MLLYCLRKSVEETFKVENCTVSIGMFCSCPLTLVYCPLARYKSIVTAGSYSQSQLVPRAGMVRGWYALALSPCMLLLLVFCWSGDSALAAVVLKRCCLCHIWYCGSGLIWLSLVIVPRIMVSCCTNLAGESDMWSIVIVIIVYTKVASTVLVLLFDIHFVMGFLCLCEQFRELQNVNGCGLHRWFPFGATLSVTL